MGPKRIAPSMFKASPYLGWLLPPRPPRLVLGSSRPPRPPFGSGLPPPRSPIPRFILGPAQRRIRTTIASLTGSNPHRTHCTWEGLACEAASGLLGARVFFEQDQHPPNANRCYRIAHCLWRPRTVRKDPKALLTQCPEMIIVKTRGKDGVDILRYGARRDERQNSS